MAAQPRPRLSDSRSPVLQWEPKPEVPGFEWPQRGGVRAPGSSLSGSRAPGGEALADPQLVHGRGATPGEGLAEHHWNPALFVYHSNRVSSRRQSHPSKFIIHAVITKLIHYPKSTIQLIPVCVSTKRKIKIGIRIREADFPSLACFRIAHHVARQWSLERSKSARDPRRTQYQLGHPTTTLSHEASKHHRKRQSWSFHVWRATLAGHVATEPTLVPAFLLWRKPP